MKKLNFAIFGALLAISLVTRALAETTIPWTKAGCESVKGKWLTAHSADEDGCDAAHCNGKNFCRSGTPMNWWSSLIFCQSIGHKLVSWENLCPGTIQAMEDSRHTCTNIKKLDGNFWGWLETLWGTNGVILVRPSDGLISWNYRNHYSGVEYAICEE